MRIALASLVLVTLAADVRANGRDPYTSTINFRKGSDQDILAGMTFGLVVSHDGGVTWQWMCEKAVGYAGMYDPDYAYSSSDSVFATTFDGLKVMRDRCSFNATPPGMTFVSKVEIGPDNAVYFAAADPMDAKVYKSTNDGVSFPTSSSPGQAGDWWSSLSVAPSDASRVYLTGYRLVQNMPKLFLLKRSIDGGATWSDMSQVNITPVSANSIIEVVGISATNPAEVYIKVNLENGSTGDSIYKSTDGGANWTKILSKASNFGLAFLKRKDGTCIAGTRELGAWTSASCNTTWTPLANAPHIGCLAQDSAGVVWACTQNYASPQLNITSDDYGIMKSSDLSTWTGVLQYQAITEPVQCAPGTIEYDQCQEPYMGMGSVWCCLVSQLGITATTLDCGGARACFGNTGDDTAGHDDVKPPKTKCGCESAGAPAMLTLLVGIPLLRRRKRAKL